MICEKCGKSNIGNLSECAYCGAEMPKTSGGGGFADILSYNAADATIPIAVKPDMLKNEKEKPSEGISEVEMLKLIKKSDNIMKSTRVNSLFGIVAIGLSLLILISSIIFGIITINAVKGYKEETMTQIEETKKELNEYKQSIDKVITEISKSDDLDENNNGEENNNNEKPGENDQRTNGNTNPEENINNNDSNPSSNPNKGTEGNRIN